MIKGGKEVLGNWPTYNKDNQRTGFYPENNATGFGLLWRSAKLDGQIYAEPLLYSGMVFVATENDSVYALNATTGEIVWRTNLGTPVKGNELPCGNIDPSGITSTPVIDKERNLLYTVAFVEPKHHLLFALDVLTGSVRFSLLADPPNSDPAVEQQRGALALANGMVYIAYGGLFGDCGIYHGYIVSLHENGSQGIRYYQVPTSREGGIWAPGGPTIDKTGNLYVATGNGASQSSYDGGNSVIKLDSSLNELDYFAPANWAYLNTNDLDLGSTSPILVKDGLVLQIGKEGIAYLVNSSNMGGIGGEVASLRVCAGAYGSVAYDGKAVYIPCVDGLYKVFIDGRTMKTAWYTQDDSGPPIVTGSTVWTIDHRTGKLLGLDQTSGKIKFSFNLGNTNRFTTPAAGQNALIVTGEQYVYCFLSS